MKLFGRASPINGTLSIAQSRYSALFIAALMLVVVKLWLVSAQPVVARGDAIYDDRLFLELANHLLDGHWLGPYSQLTLVKGPMYSLWIAATFLVGVPLPLAQHLFYLLGCTLLVLALRPCLSAAWQAFAMFALLWWQPMSYVELAFLRAGDARGALETLRGESCICGIETEPGGQHRHFVGWLLRIRYRPPARGSRDRRRVVHVGLARCSRRRRARA